ncbi:MAG: isopentenyl phosphate kinase [Candidatus Micrarchaeaceae archaeon]
MDRKKMLILIKLGGSVITDVHKPNTARMANIRRLINEIKKASKNKSIIIGHGGGSFPHVPAYKYRINSGLAKGKNQIGTTITQSSAATLHQIMMVELAKAGVQAFSFSPSSSIIANRRKIIRWDTAPIAEALERDFVPVVYGDVALDSKQGICIVSTEEIFRYLSARLKPDKVIIGTDVDGVFTDDPKKSRDIKFIKEIRKDNMKKIVFNNKWVRKYNVTGGMKSKVELLYNMSKRTSLVCQVVNANVPNRIYNAILGKPVVSTIIRT